MPITSPHFGTNQPASQRRGRRTLPIAAATAAAALVAGLAPWQLPAAVVAAPTTTTLTAVADSYVDATKPTTNYGSRATVYADGSPSRATLIRFAVPAAAGSVTRATLRLYVSAGSSSGITVAPAGNGWTESTVTWSNAPAAGSPLSSLAQVGNGTWASIDVTSAVKPGAEVTLRITTPGSRQVAASAREAGTATAPQLVVDSASVAPTPTTTTSVAPSPSTSVTASSTPTSSSTPTTPPSASATPTGDIQPAYPIRATFYYPWFPEAWSQSGISPFTWYQPSRGFYDGRDRAVVASQIGDMMYAGLEAGIASWWGRGSKEDTRIPMLLSAAAGTPFRWSLYYEPESLGDPSADQIRADLTHIVTSFGSDPSFLRINGRPVVFVYADAADACGMADRWKAGNTVGAHIVLKVFSGYATCASQPQGWHQYGPATPRSSHLPHAFGVSPGFWLRTDSAPRLVRDLARFDADVAAMAASSAQFHLVQTYNEWGEGTSVESATQWASPSGRGAYLDILRKHLVGTSTPSAPTASPTATASPTTSSTASVSSTDPVIAAAGDIACDPTSSSFNGGLGTSSSCKQMATSDLALGIPGLTAVLPLGDIQYEDGVLDKYHQSYDTSWGRLKSITRPAVGNHEYLTANASGYFTYFGAAAGDPRKGYYSYDLGAWHVVALNSNCSSVGGCAEGSAQLAWLKADLAANPRRCTLAYWHHPRFSSGQHGSDARTTPLWDALAAAGAEVVLSGHDHMYERFGPQTSAGVADANGIRQFVVGNGGKNHTGVATVRANSEVRNSDTFGVLQMTLRPDRYEWKHLPEPGRTFSDSGTTMCH